MAVKKPAKKVVVAKASKGKTFSDAEKAAMQARVKELQAGDGDLESEVLAKIADMPPADRAMGQRIHVVVRAAAPALSPKLYYGMPSYAKDGKVICFFKPASKFKTRYATFGFNDTAKLDDGIMWPVEFALKDRLTAAEEARIAALVKKAAG